jgi:hypothetical protein
MVFGDVTRQNPGLTPFFQEQGLWLSLFVATGA